MKSRNRKHRSLCEALVHARKSAGLSQHQLAARLKRPQSYVAKIEIGERRLEVVEFAQIVRSLGMKPSRLCAKILD